MANPDRMMRAVAVTDFGIAPAVREVSLPVPGEGRGTPTALADFARGTLGKLVIVQ